MATMDDPAILMDGSAPMGATTEPEIPSGKIEINR